MRLDRNFSQDVAARDESPMPRRVAQPRTQDVCRAECFPLAFSLCEAALECGASAPL